MAQVRSATASYTIDYRIAYRIACAPCGMHHHERAMIKTEKGLKRGGLL
jgi:hypothetical protein